MRLIVLTPTERVLDASVSAVVVETVTGSVCLLPRRLDMATSLRPGILVARVSGGAEHYVAIDGGVLVKVGPDVTVAAPRAVVGDDLLALRERIDARSTGDAQDARAAAGALARCEITIVRRLRELEEGRHV